MRIQRTKRKSKSLCWSLSTADINQDGICKKEKKKAYMNHVSILNLMALFILSELCMWYKKNYSSNLLIQFKMNFNA